MLLLFYLFGAISIWLGLLSLRGGIRFRKYVRSELAKGYEQFTPFVTVFMPLRGIDAGLRENVAALLSQNYPKFEIIFIADRAEDPALAVVDDARKSFAHTKAVAIQVVIAGDAICSGQKVHNLNTAIKYADAKAQVFVFVDSDACPAPNWLRSLVAPLRDEDIGAATGYRWFVARSGGVASHLLSVWNAAIASALGADGTKNFCWGGSTAIRRATFEKSGVLDYWRGAVSDDFAMTRALHDAKLSITFVPQCLTPSFHDCNFRELIEFSSRQLKITCAYASHLWKSVFIGSAIFVITFFGGIGLVIARASLHLSFAPALVLLLIIFAMGAVKSYLRLRAVSAIIPAARTASSIIAHVILWPLASALYLYNAVAAAASRRITWRGITYELKSPNETVIIGRQ